MERVHRLTDPTRGPGCESLIVLLIASGDGKNCGLLCGGKIRREARERIGSLMHNGLGCQYSRPCEY
jgi:hypothetical protein